MKKELPAGPLTWNGNRFKKDQKAICASFIRARTRERDRTAMPSLPLTFLTATPGEHRVVNACSPAPRPQPRPTTTMRCRH
jgi:hypothetical protein